MAKPIKTTSPKADAPKTERKVSPLDNVSYDALILQAKEAIDASLARDTENVKANQTVAWAVMRYREKMVADGVAPLDLTKFKAADTDSTALSKWRTEMATKYLGKAPTARGGMDQGKITGKDNYKARRRIFDDACNLVCIFVNAGVTTEHYSDDRGCFAIPGSLLIPRDKAYVPDFELKEAMEAASLIPLLNRSYLIRDKATGKSVKTIRSSVAQVLMAWKSKPAKQAAGSGAGNSDAQTGDGAATGNGANDRTTSLDMKAVRAAMKTAPITSLLRPFWDNIVATRKDGWKLADYTTSERNDILNIAGALNALIQQDADANKAKAEADKVKPDNVVNMPKPAPRKAAANK